MIVLVAAGTASTARAQTHAGDIVLMLINSRLATSGGPSGSYMGPLTGRVFDGFFPSGGSTTAPGFESAPGLLQPGETIRVDFAREVLYWNGTQLTTSPRSMTVGLGSSQVTLSGTDFSGKPGFEIAGGDPTTGAFHQHPFFQIGSGAPAGVYGAIMRLAMVRSGSNGPVTFGTSLPFLMTFRRNASSLSPAAGLNAMADVLATVPDVPPAVPEPTTLGLAAAGAIAGLAARFRRRPRKNRNRNTVASASAMH